MTEPLSTARLLLEPITEDHAQELWDLLNDPELHRFVPFEAISIDKMKERCARWEHGKSPDGKEIWLNWAARENKTGRVVAHLQAGIAQEGVATIGYTVATHIQRQGIATEGLTAIFAFLREKLLIKEIKAWSDTRNLASHELAKKLGMTQVEFIKDADFFKGGSSDEFVFSKKL